MKICLYYKTTTKPWGGTNSFILNLKNYLISKNIKCCNDPNKDYEIILINGAYTGPGKQLKLREIYNLKKYGYTSFFKYLINGFKKREIKTILRLDGLRKIYSGIETPMDRIQSKLVNLVDHIIFQSEFSLKCFQETGYQKNNYSIISNGVNQDVFNIKNTLKWNKQDRLKIVAASWSNNLAKGHKVISDFSLLENIEISFIGNWNDQVPVNKVKLFPPMSHSQISKIFKKSDIFLFPAENESCPNILLEALSCGLPVLYSNSGANKELVEKFGVEIKKNYLNSINKISNHYEMICTELIKNINSFSIENSGKRYLEVLKKVINE